MPKAGTIGVHISPFEARFVVAWMKAQQPSLWELLQNGGRVPSRSAYAHLIDQMASYAKRKRSTGMYTRLILKLKREEASRLAAKVRRGMFGGGNRIPLPPIVEHLCWQCALALKTKRGRKQLHGQALEAAIDREKRLVKTPDSRQDPSHMFALKRKQRDEAKVARLTEHGLLGAAPPQNAP